MIEALAEVKEIFEAAQKAAAAARARAQEVKRYKAIRRQRRVERRSALKSLGYRPNRRMTRCKRTGIALQRPGEGITGPLPGLAPAKESA